MVTRVGFKNSHSLEERKNDSENTKRKYPDRIPVIVERKEGAEVPCLTRHKYLLTKDVTANDLIMIIKKVVSVYKEGAFEGEISFDVGERSVDTITQPGLPQIYESNKDEDGFLYIYYFPLGRL